MSTFLFKKEVDQSLLKAGLTIPNSIHGIIQDVLGIRLSKGQRAEIRIHLDGQIYNAVLSNVNLSEAYSNRTVYQIRYSEGSPICQKLKSLFSSSDTKQATDYIYIYANDDKTLEFQINNSIKDSFIKYIGPSDSLTGYQRSYKLVFYKVLFSRLLSDQGTYCDSIAYDFQQYYLERKNAGLLPDVDADSIIQNIDKSTVSQVNNLILRNPYNAINSHGFILTNWRPVKNSNSITYRHRK